jgi:transcriptional regulator with XRE-family HTH domain
MTQRDIAGYLGVDRTTLYNWKKNKPNLYKTVMKGLAFDDMIEKAERNLEELKSIQENFGKVPNVYKK